MNLIKCSVSEKQEHFEIPGLIPIKVIIYRNGETNEIVNCSIYAGLGTKAEGLQQLVDLLQQEINR